MLSVQRNRFLFKLRGYSPDLANRVGQRSAIPAPGRRLARNDGSLLSEQRLASAVARYLRSPLRVQTPARLCHLGTGPRRFAACRKESRFMNFEPLEKIANAVLYEGFLLYPYRKSAVKNQQRWHFGTIGAPGGADPVLMQT